MIMKPLINNIGSKSAINNIEHYLKSVESQELIHKILASGTRFNVVDVGHI